MSSGFISSMIASLKSNNSIRRSKRGNNIFSSQVEFEGHEVQPLSKEKNLRIIAENKKALELETRNKRILAFALLLLYGFIAVYMLMVYLD